MTLHESMSEADRNRTLRDMYRGGGGDNEWDYDCGILVACDKGDDDAQIEWEDYE